MIFERQADIDAVKQIRCMIRHRIEDLENICRDERNSRITGAYWKAWIQAFRDAAEAVRQPNEINFDVTHPAEHVRAMYAPGTADGRPFDFNMAGVAMHAVLRYCDDQKSSLDASQAVSGNLRRIADRNIRRDRETVVRLAYHYICRSDVIPLRQSERNMMYFALMETRKRLENVLVDPEAERAAFLRYIRQLKKIQQQLSGIVVGAEFRNADALILLQNLCSEVRIMFHPSARYTKIMQAVQILYKGLERDIG